MAACLENEQNPKGEIWNILGSSSNNKKMKEQTH